jgi:CHAT domain-containing protein
VALLKSDRSAWLEAKLALIRGCLARASSCEALDVVDAALAEAGETDTPFVAPLQLAAAEALIIKGRLEEASVRLDLVRKVAEGDADPGVSARLAQDSGVLAALRTMDWNPSGREGTRGVVMKRVPRSQAPHEEITAYFEKAASLARQAKDPQLELRALLHLARIHAAYGHRQEAASALSRVDSLLGGGEAKAADWLVAGVNHLALSEGRDPASNLARGGEVLDRAVREAESAGDAAVKTFALGYLGSVKEAQGELDAAFELTGRALQVGQTAGNERAIFEWQWQAARILEAKGQPGRAKQLYRLAVDSFGRVRSSFRTRGMSLIDYPADPARALYGLARLNFKLADSAEDETDRDRLLREARDAVEALRSYQVENQFLAGECSSLLAALSGSLDKAAATLDRSTAVIYLVPLEDTTEILLTLPGGRLVRRTVPEGRPAMESQAEQLQAALAGKAYEKTGRPVAEALYRLLMAPIESLLADAGVTQLIFIADGALARIPMSVLHDGSKFLIERFAIATSPGLALMEPGRRRSGAGTVFIGALTTKEGELDLLKSVEQEAHAIEALFKHDTLMGEDFTEDNIRKAIGRKSYNYVHLASHATFGRTEEESFVVTRNGRVTLTELQEIVRPTLLREQPIELLSLSACETAAGGAGIELGLAGIGLRSGARSVLGSLWEVEDAGTARLMARFYELLAGQGLTKAEALQQAQRDLLADDTFKEPHVWSAFVLVGNWR